MDSDQTTVHVQPRSDGPRPADTPPHGTQQAFAETLRAELADRVRVGGVAVVLIAALASVFVWPQWPILVGMAICGAVAAVLPRALRERVAEPLAALLGLVGVVAAVSLASPTSLGTSVVVSMLLALLLPTRVALRVGTLVAHGALIMIFARPSLLEIPLAVGTLAIAFWFGHLQISHWRTLWEDREKLAGLTQTLEQQALRQKIILTRRESELVAQHETMVKQEKWATLGRVATGVAHEIKNPLQAAFADLDTARRTGELHLLDDVEVSLRRIENIARDVSRLRGTSTSAVSAYDLQPLLRASVRSARMGLKNLRVMEGQVPAVVVSCNQSLLVEILANLLTNAAHAVGGRGGGRVKLHATLTAHRVLVYVDDDGPGIPAGAEDRVFEAFVTTKAAGKGTGLGLPISRSKLQAMGGDLWAEQGSTLGGARLVVALAYAPTDAARAPVDSPSGPPPRQSHPVTPVAEVERTTSGPAGTLLLIDDDASVRRALSRALGRQWRVLLASGTREARSLARRETVDVVLCDMHLLQEDAIDVLNMLERIDRTLPGRTVFMSGEPTSSRLLALAEGNPDRMIGKPFDPRVAHAKLLAAKAHELAPLERIEDIPTPPSVGALEPVWSFEAPTEEITFDDP